MIKIDFMGGLHGGFLCYSINALNSDFRIDSPFTKHGTSHVPHKRIIADTNHYSFSKTPIESDKIISITADDDDCLLVNLLSYSRAGDFLFDLKNFHINFYDQIKNTSFNTNIIDHIYKSYNIKIDEMQSIPRGILREYFKFNFHDYKKNNIISEIRKQVYSIDVLEFNFKELYSFNSYIKILNSVVEQFELPYIVDSDWYYRLWIDFMSKIDAIPCSIDAELTLKAVQQGLEKPIDFNLLQESWLNARLEVLYNKEMPFDQEVYFTNTKEIIEYLK